MKPIFRKDPIVERWVAIAPERAARPHDADGTGAVCPFCRGQEHLTPPAHACYPAVGDWQVRVVPNRFPAVRLQGELHPRRAGLYEEADGLGLHDLVIECPQHERSLANLPASHLALILQAYRDRLVELRADSRLAYAQVFKNCGADAGASLEHAHSQIISGPMVPKNVQTELDACIAYHHDVGRCRFCDLWQAEVQAGVRVVATTAQFAAFTAYAGRFPYETWLLPCQHASHFESTTNAELHELAELLRLILRKLDQALDRPAYNFFLHTAPLRTDPLTHYHWHLELLPRVTGVAGFEWAAGAFINPVPPEDAAARLRAADAG
jgi:UDPglucose--hexose-1-phosphate uridylyltransferase